MAVQYRVDGSVAVTPAIPPVQHNWNPLYRSLEMEEANKAAKAKAIQDEKIARANKAAKDAEFTPEGVPDINLETSLQEKYYKPYFSNVVKGKKYGMEGTMEHDIRIQSQKNEAQLAKNKADAIKTERTNAFLKAKENPNYVDQNAMNLAIDEASYVWGPDGLVDIDKTDPERIAQAAANYVPYIKPYEMYGKILKDIGTSIDDRSITYDSANPDNPDITNRTMYSNKVSANFLKPITVNGKIQMVPGVTDKDANFVMESHPDVKADAEYKLEQYLQGLTQERLSDPNNAKDPRLVYLDVQKNIDKGKWLTDYVRSNIEQFNQGQTQRESSATKIATPGSGSGNTKKVMLGKPVESNINFNLGSEKGNYVATGFVPFEQTISSKGEGTVQPLTINTEELVNIDTNEREKPVGSQPFHPRAIVKVPIQTINGQEQIYVNTKDKVLSNKNVHYKYFVDGQVEYDFTNAEGKTTKKKKSAMIDASKIANELVERGVKMEDYIPKANDPYGIK